MTHIVSFVCRIDSMTHIVCRVDSMTHIVCRVDSVAYIVYVGLAQWHTLCVG